MRSDIGSACRGALAKALSPLFGRCSSTGNHQCATGQGSYVGMVADEGHCEGVAITCLGKAGDRGRATCRQPRWAAWGALSRNGSPGIC